MAPDQRTTALVSHRYHRSAPTQFLTAPPVSNPTVHHSFPAANVRGCRTRLGARIAGAARFLAVTTTSVPADSLPVVLVARAVGVVAVDPSDLVAVATAWAVAEAPLRDTAAALPAEEGASEVDSEASAVVVVLISGSFGPLNGVPGVPGGVEPYMLMSACGTGLDTGSTGAPPDNETQPTGA
jgi:hypothetical protein